MVLQSMITLASAALGLVAALAWNDAIKETMSQILGAKYTYAILVTLVAVIVVLGLARIAGKIGGEAAIAREAEG